LSLVSSLFTLPAQSLFDICHTSFASSPGIDPFDPQLKTLMFRLHVAIGCCESIEILHQQQPPICHGDVKGQNFLLHSDFMIKIADLELASRCFQGNNEDMESKTSSSYQIAQLRLLSQSVTPDDPEYRISETYNWLAPEVIVGQAQTPSSDIYSLAMTMFEVLTDQVPFHELNISSKFEPEELKHQICHHNVRPGSSQICEEMDILLSSMWKKEQSDRPNIAAVLLRLRSIACQLLFGPLEFTIINNDDQMAESLFGDIEKSGLAGAVLDASPPFRIKFVSSKWQEVCGWSSAAVVNKTVLQCLRGPRTNATRTRNLKRALALDAFFVSGCVHYRENGAAQLHVFSTTKLKCPTALAARPNKSFPKLILLRSATMIL
jgi:serine/threonine protein kinase